MQLNENYQVRDNLEKRRISCTYEVSNMEKSTLPIREMIVSDMTRQLSSEIVSAKLEEEPRELTTAYRMSAYVISPEELEQLIMERVEKRLSGKPSFL